MRGERPIGSNRIRRLSKHPRNRETQRCKLAVRGARGFDTEYVIPSGRVDILTVAYMDTTGRKKLLDGNNVNDKDYIDGLIGHYVTDDDNRYIRNATRRSEVDNENPRVEIIITEVPSDVV